MVRTRSAARLASANSDEDQLESTSSGQLENLPPDKVERWYRSKKSTAKKSSAVVAPTPVVTPMAPVSVINYTSSTAPPPVPAPYIPITSIVHHPHPPPQPQHQQHQLHQPHLQHLQHQQHQQHQPTTNLIPQVQIQPISTGCRQTSQFGTLHQWLLSQSRRMQEQVSRPMECGPVGYMLDALKGGGYPVHPDVKFRRLPFYQETAELMRPSTLVPTTGGRIQENTFYFHLTPQQSQTIMNAPEVNVIQVQLRFCMVETSCEQDDCFPPSCCVKINNKTCPLPMPIPTNKCGVEAKRPPGPVNITSLLKLSPTMANTVVVSWGTDFMCRYAVCVSLVRRLTPSLLLSRLKNKGTKNPDYTRSLIKEKLREDLDCEIATTSLRVSLVCPLGKMRMVCPCRPVTCIHLQCFDASLFLQMNERKPTWVCPVCDKPALYDNLVVDGYFLEVLNSPRLTEDCTEIQLHKDGSWSAHTKTDIVPEQIFNDVEVIQDDMDVIPLSDGSDSSTGLPSLKRSACSREGFPDQPSPRPVSSSIVVGSTTVDLTSDSEDDLPLRRKVPQQQSGDSNTEKKNTTESSSAAPSKEQRHSSLDLAISSIISLDSPSPLTVPTSPMMDSSTPPMEIETLDPTLDLDDPAETTEALKQISSNELPIDLQTPERPSPANSPTLNMSDHSPEHSDQSGENSNESHENSEGSPDNSEHSPESSPKPVNKNMPDDEDPIKVTQSDLEDTEGPDKSGHEEIVPDILTPERLTVEVLEKPMDIVNTSSIGELDPLEIAEPMSNITGDGVSSEAFEDMDDSIDFLKETMKDVFEKRDEFDVKNQEFQPEHPEFELEHREFGPENQEFELEHREFGPENQEFEPENNENDSSINDPLRETSSEMITPSETRSIPQAIVAPYQPDLESQSYEPHQSQQ